MVKSLVSKLSSASNLSLASTLSSVAGSGGGGAATQDTNYSKHRNDPGRFFGDGVQFKAKLIGILEVGEARGDRMCQEALQDLKMAIRAAGEHKQRITIHVTIDGLRLRDEKTGDSLYHHPVHKISFIAQDMTDSRAFGYIFGSPDSGHRFFGIKTDKAASQVVLAMRDLFQVVFELKKKEIELARQQIQSKSIHDHQLASLSSLKSAGGANNDLSGSAGASSLSMLGSLSGQGATGISRLGVNLDYKGSAKEMSPESVADLVDLEQELSSIQRGITQMERITPSDPVQPAMSGSGSKAPNEEDPFGDSFTNFPTYNLLPPPESGRSRHKQPSKPSESSSSAAPAAPAISSILSPAPAASSSPANLPQDDDDCWLHELDPQHDVFDTTKPAGIGMGAGMPMAPLAASESTSTPTQQLSENSAYADNELCVAAGNGNSGTARTSAASAASSVGGTDTTLDQFSAPAKAVKSDAFTDLDPLGTGRTRPYVDKKYFFQELKNPPKKVLKELSSNVVGLNNGAATSNVSTGGAPTYAVDEFLGKDGGCLLDDNHAGATVEGAAACVSNDAVERTTAKQQQLLNVTTNTNSSSEPTANDPVMLPRDTDPFSPTRKKSDPFQEGDIFSKLDPFEFEFQATKSECPAVRRASPATVAAATVSAEVFNGPLQVNLPPERGASPSANVAGMQWKSGVTSRIEPGSSIRSRPTPSGQMASATSSSLSSANAASSIFKQQTADVISSISNKKMPHLFGQARFSKRDSNSINMRRLQESDSLSENETAPEPPPRPDSATHAEPPPLPPKKQFNDIVIRPRVTSGNAMPPSHSVTTSSRYEFLYAATKMSAPATTSEVPPIPLPSRRVGRSDGAFPGPDRPRKPGHMEDDYLAPIGVAAVSASGPTSSQVAGADVPPLLPPPTQISTRARAQRQQSVSSNKSQQEIYENKNEILQHQKQKESTEDAAVAAIIPDITLSQLLTLGIDELATKLNVPTSKLSTMTLVELTSYLSEFIEQSKCEQKSAQPVSPVPARARVEQAPVFRVNFDQQSTFVAKFDDTFGEDMRSTGDSFVANFAQFNVTPPVVADAHSCRQTPAIPSADRYAVFREIIDQELQHQQQETDLICDITPPEEGPDNLAACAQDIEPSISNYDNQYAAAADDFLGGAPMTQAPPPPPKIDTKITEVVAQAKDRYAALRDIILVENLFDKKPPPPLLQTHDLMQELPEFSDEFNEDQDLKQIMDDQASSNRPDRLSLADSRGFPCELSSSALTVEDDDEDEDGAGESSLDSNDKDAAESGGARQDQYEKLSTSNQQLDIEKPESTHSATDTMSHHSLSLMPNAKQDSKFLTVASSIGLSNSKDDLEIDELMQRAISNLSLDSRDRISPANSTNTSATRATTLSAQPQFADVNTSPIPLQKSPGQQRSPLPKSQQSSPIMAKLTAVSQLIDTASKQLDADALGSKPVKESWATFDSPKVSLDTDKRGVTIVSAKSSKGTSLQLPPPPPSNNSQNDTAESPCSSDPRDEGWSKSAGGGPGTRGHRWAKKERHQTSSSSRDLSPWDDEAPDYQKPHRAAPIAAPFPHADRHGYYMRHARRMNSCDEDYDYEEELSSRREQRKFKQGISRSRDNFDLDSPSWYHQPPHHTWSPQDIESASARGRGFDRSAYERTTYGPPIYDKRGIALAAPVSGSGGGGGGLSSYDRRSGYDKRKYYRDYARPNYDFDEYGEAPPIQERYREVGSCEKLKSGGRRADYENVYDEGRSPMGYKSRADYVYERERKSFDRESIESYESASRRRRSFGSGDVYGSVESREDFRDRYMGAAEKTRSLRKGMKMRTTGDIDYEQDSEGDFHQQRPARVGHMEARNMQRPSQLGGGGGMGLATTQQTRMRKSSGSSPWDGEEPPLAGGKSWKRPSSAVETERRLAENRRAANLGQTPSGSDGEKDRRFRKKQRQRGSKDMLPNSGSGGLSSGRYGGVAHPRDNYDYITYDDDIDDEGDYVDEEYDEPPTDEDKFERLNRRRHEMHQRMLESERRQHGLGKPSVAYKSGATISLPATAVAVATKKYHMPHVQRGGIADYDYEEYTQTPTPRSNASTTGGVAGGSSGSAAHPMAGTKFSFDGGFESDFNQGSPPPVPAGTGSSCNSTPAPTGSATTTPATKSSFRFSNDFTERDKLQAFAQNSTSASSLQQYELESAVSPAPHATPPTQKLRFDDNVKVSQFEDVAFEDDFAKASFDFDSKDSTQWYAPEQALPTTNVVAVAATASKKQNLRNSKLQQRKDLNVKKSESINIFAKKAEDPFEDDEFFKAPSEAKGATEAASSAADNGNNGNGGAAYQWHDDANFAKFDENM